MRALILRFGLVQALVTVIGGLLAPIMYLMLMEKGVQLHQFGALISVSTLSAILCEMPFGTLSDQLGRKRVFLLGEGVLVLVATGMLLADSFVQLLPVMALNGLATALFSGSLDALFVEQVEKLNDSGAAQELQQAQALFGISQVLGLAAGSVLSGLLPGWLRPFSERVSWLGFYEVNCAIMIPCLLLHIVFTALVLEESSVANPRLELKQALRSVRPIIKQAAGVVRAAPALQLFLLIEFIGGVAIISLEQFWQPRLATLVDSKQSTWLFGALFAVSYVCGAIGQALSIPLAQTFRHRYDFMLIVLELLLAALFIVAAAQHSLAGFVTAYLVLFLVAGVTVSPFLTLFHSLVPETHRSTMLSIKSLVTQCDAMLGALVAGVIANNFGIAAAWTAAGCLFLVSASLYLFPAVSAFARSLASSTREQKPSAS